MKNFNYIFSAIGWLGLIVCLVIILAINKCGNNTAPTHTIEKTIINNYYDSSPKIVPQTTFLPGKPIPVFVPQDVDTAKILAAFFSKYPYKRIFENDSIRVTLVDTICQNNFLSPGKFSYEWLKPIKTVTSTTVTITNEAIKRFQLFAGAHADFQQKYFYDWGPEMYLMTKRGQLFGAGYDVKHEVYSFKAALNLNEAFRNKNK